MALRSCDVRWTLGRLTINGAGGSGKEAIGDEQHTASGYQLLDQHP